MIRNVAGYVGLIILNANGRAKGAGPGQGQRALLHIYAGSEQTPRTRKETVASAESLSFLSRHAAGVHLSRVTDA